MKKKRIEIIGLPIDLGADTRGVDMGPTALRIAGLVPSISQLGYEVIDLGNTEVKISSMLSLESTSMKYVEEIVSACNAYAKVAESILDRGSFPLFIGGDHSMALGSLAGISAYCKKNDKRLGVLWIDAHTDMNTARTSPSGNVHGMPLAASLGIGDPILTGIYGHSPKILPSQTALMGIRSIDSKEMALTRNSGISVCTMSDIDKKGVYTIISDILAKFKGQIDHLHVSFDMDSVDPELAPGVGTPVPGGLTFRETHTVMEAIASCGLLASFEITEVNPILDQKNKTAQLAVDFLESALGKRIL